MAPFYVQAYDVCGAVVAHADCEDEQRTHAAFLALCCSADRVVDRVEAFMAGDSEPVVYGYRNCRSMRNLIMDTAIRNVVH